VIIREYPKNEIKTPVHLGVGLEGISVGVAHVLPPNSKCFGPYRNHGQYLALTGETDEFFGELYGKTTGTGGGKAGSMDLCSPAHGLVSTSGIVASTISLAVGAGLAAKYRGTDGVAVAMFGDAAIEEGEFWESLNFACLHQLPVLFVCEDNDLAVHTFGASRRGFESIAEVVRGFNCHVWEGDGADVLTVMEMTRGALAAMRRDQKPAFLCLRWYRFLEHCGPNTDFHVGYRPQPSEDELQRADPILKYERFLKQQGLPESELTAVRAQVDAQIEKSLAAAREAPFPDGAKLYEDLFA
jgi:TPP-dependent pyruvate/acetoin dehydrogenase alpha subunit